MPAFHRISLAVALVSAAVVLGATSQASANLVADGDFSIPPVDGDFTTINAGGTIGPWSVDTGSVDLIGNYWQAPPLGGGSVDLDGNAPGSISQSLDLGAGNYSLSFYLSGNPDGLPSTKTVEVTIGGVTKTFTFTIGGNSHGSMNYVLETLAFNWGGGDTALDFISLDTDSPYGPVIGDVDLQAAPLPAALSLFAGGLGVIGLISRRRNRKRQVATPAA
jgi:choice-of-anchor C domain-containing protein